MSATMRQPGPADGPVPARQVLAAAMATNRRLGHENLGFLSESHGFIPQRPPLANLPAAFEEWDRIGAELPELCRRLSLRRRLDAMPVLSAAEDALPEPMLLRASVLVSNFAHAYHYLEPAPPAALPASIRRPWQEIAWRLGRREAHMSYVDMSTYNWRLLDPAAPDPMRVENLEPLVPVWGNEAERIFLGSTVEILAQSTPLVGAMVRAQEAAQRDDPAALEVELQAMIGCLRHLTYACLPKIVQNPLSGFFVDPVVWAKTIAPLSVPIRKGAAGPVGAATPSLQALDAFFERESYRSDIGQESSLVRAWYPRHWSDFFAAVGRVSVPAYVQRAGGPELARLFRDTLHAYAGDGGFLGRHRLKAYGYIETAFKIGRPATAAFEGSFRDRVWDDVDRQLDLARQERYRHFSAGDDVYRARLRDLVPVSEGGTVMQVRLALEGHAFFRPGDRCAILPQNGERLVDRTLRALGASGGEAITLDPIWRAAAAYRAGWEGAERMPLRMLLGFAQLRPLRRPVARLLYALSRSPTLGEVLQAHAEEDWELWDLVERLAAEGFDPTSLWRPANGEPPPLCQVAPPERFRTYSISSAPSPASGGVTELDLTVGELSYGPGRQGVAPAFLAARPSRPFPVRIVPAPAFGLPPDPARPVVLFAGGAGIAPFRAFLQERARDPAAGVSWLYYAVRSGRDLCYRQELATWVADGRLQVRVACSREDLGFDSELRPVPGHRARIGELIRGEAGLLRRLLGAPEAGGASVYVCGRMDFASAVEAALLGVLEGAAGPSPARDRLQQLAAQGRYQQETFTALAPPREAGLYDVSEVARHNQAAAGRWLVIDDAVYDVGGFCALHPGGSKILRAYAGMDATPAFRRVGHDRNQEVQAMLGAYRIGNLRRPELGEAALEEAYRGWVAYLFLIVEIENALDNDFGFQQEAATHDESPAGVAVSPVKLMMHFRSHQRCVEEFLPQLTGAILRELWQGTAPLCGADSAALARALDVLPQAAAAEHTAACFERFVAELKDDAADLPALQARCRSLEQGDRRLLAQWKEPVRAIVQRIERGTTGAPVAELAARLPGVARRYYAEMMDEALAPA